MIQARSDASGFFVAYFQDLGIIKTARSACIVVLNVVLNTFDGKAIPFLHLKFLSNDRGSQCLSIWLMFYNDRSSRTGVRKICSSIDRALDKVVWAYTVVKTVCGLNESLCLDVVERERKGKTNNTIWRSGRIGFLNPISLSASLITFCELIKIKFFVKVVTL